MIVDYEINNENQLKIGVTTDPDIAFGLVVDARNGEGRVFKRNAIQLGAGEKITWLVGELDGVRVYVLDDGTLVMTKADMYYSAQLIDNLVRGDYDG